MIGAISNRPSRKRRRPKRSVSSSQDFELNITSIIDCFTVLIAFMLVSTSFVAIGIIDAGAAASGAVVDKAKTCPVNVVIELKAAHVLGVKVAGAKNAQLTLAAGPDKNWSYDALARELLALKTKWPTLEGATLVADNTVDYRDVVKAMDVSRQTLPAILLGGF